MSSMGGPSDKPLPPEFKPEEQELIAALKQVKGGYELDKMLVGALRAIKAEDNPDSFAHTAQSARVLIEKFEHGMHGLTAASLRDKGRENFKVRTDRHRAKWEKAKKGSKTFKDGKWSGKIDPPLQELLGETADFMEWFANHDIYRKNKEEAVVLHLDPMFSALSQSEQARIVREWVQLRGFFNNVAHHNKRDVTQAEMDDALVRLVRYLHRRLAPVDVANKAAILAHIQECEKRGVLVADVARLETLLGSGADAAFFFNTLTNPGWLTPLQAAGYFNSPPEPQKKEDMELHPVWPQCGYLIKTAPLAPAEVSAILAAMPATRNETVNEAIFRAAAALPSANVAPVVSRIHRWLKAAQIRWHSMGLVKFLRHVAQSGNTKAAAGMLEGIIQFAPGKSDDEGKPVKGSLFNWTPEPTTRLESHEYGEFLRGVLPALVTANSRRALLALCRVLNGYIIARGRRDSQRPGYDGSTHWRPSIDDSGQNSLFDVVTELVTALRNLVDSEVTAGRLKLDDVLVVTGVFHWDIFRRLEMYWIFGALDQCTHAMLRAALMKRSRARSERFDLEYGKLLNAGFSKLATKDQKTILGWIAAGPDVPPTTRQKRGAKFQKQFQDWSDRWRVKKYYWIKDQLPAALKKKYQRWAAKGWEPLHPGFTSWVGGFQEGDAKSPIPLESFRALTLPQQANYLRTWEPPSGIRGAPSRSGLAGVLNAVIGQQTDVYVAHADTFIGVEPEYVGTLLSALWENLKAGAPQPMVAVWVLAEWVLRQDDAETELHDDFMGRDFRGRRWYSARLALARLLHSLLRATENPLPLADRARVWSTLETLAKDPDPTTEARAEEGDDESSSGPFNNSLNTIRGETFHAIFEYIGWIKRADPVLVGLPPEANELLVRHLTVATEPTRTIRSVYGANVNRLVYWDKAWLEQHREQLFPASGPELASSAWTAFITHASPAANVFQVLQPDFRKAVDSLGSAPAKDSRRDPRVRLGNYLMVLYWTGQLDFADAKGILAGFFWNASDEVRGKVMEFVGRSIKQTGGAIPPVIAERLRRFWGWRLAAARAGQQPCREEMGGFAWWFDAGKLDEKWLAEQMVEALSLSQRHANQFLWMKRFAEIADRETVLAVRALGLTREIIRAAKERFWNDEEAKLILSVGLKSTDASVVEEARRIQDAFCREGKTDFMNLP